MKRFPLLIIFCSLIGLGITTGAAADVTAFNKASDDLCQKIKQCAYQQFDDQQLTAEMRSMMEGMLNGLCDTITEHTQIENKEELKEPATACLRSMAELNCTELEDEALTTPACKIFETMSKPER